MLTELKTCSVVPAYRYEASAPYIKVGAGKSPEQMQLNMRALNLRENQERYSQAFLNLGNMVLAANDLCGSVMLDAIERLKTDKRLWRHHIKKRANDAYAAYTSYYRSIDRGVADLDIYMTYADKYLDEMKKHVDILRLSALQVMTRLEVPNRDMLSYIIAAYACLCVASDIYTFLASQLNSLVMSKVTTEYTNRNMVGIRKKWSQLVTSLIGIQTEDTICRDKNYKMACHILYERMTNMEIIDRCVENAILMNKDKFSEERLREIFNPQ